MNKKGDNYENIILWYIKFWKDEDGMGVVEVVLITIVLVGLVILFKSQITALVNSILAKMFNQANKI